MLKATEKMLTSKERQEKKWNRFSGRSTYALLQEFYLLAKKNTN
jgi:hypothetical protein